MSMSFDYIVTLHTNVATCGVARFNTELAKRLNIPLRTNWLRGERPLVSVRWDEVQGDPPLLDDIADSLEHGAGLLMHDLVPPRWIKSASVVYCANDYLLASAKAIRSDATLIHCPSTPLPAVYPQMPRVFSFGMAHKLMIEPYRKLAKMLPSYYCVRLSTAMHEGRPLDEADASLAKLRSIFGSRLAYLGWLSDVALSEELRAAHFVAAFFPRGVRANNTSVHMAMLASCVVVTNLDEYSPPEYQHGINLLDINQLSEWPWQIKNLELRERARMIAEGPFGWDALIGQFERKGVTSGT